MPKDDEKAKDGAVDTRSDEERKRDDLAERRAARSSNPTDPENGDGRSVEERAEGGEEEDDGQFAFVVEERGRKVTRASLVARGTPVEYRIVMGGKSQKGVGGLLDPQEKDILLLVRGVVSDVRDSFIRDSDENITKVVTYVTVTPKLFMDAKTEAARTMLFGEPGPAAASG